MSSRLIRRCALALAILLPFPGFGQRTVCFFGDSIMEGWMDAELHEERAYPHVIDSTLLAWHTPLRSLVVAHAGETTRDALLRMDADVLPERPDAVVIAFGTNDYYIHGYATAPRVSLDEFRRNLRLIVEKCLGIGAIPVLLGLPPNLQSRYYAFSPERLYVPYGGATALNESYDEAIRETALMNDIPYVDIHRVFDGSEPILLGFDGVHPLPEGHRLIATVVSDTLRIVLSRRPVPVGDTPMTVYPQPFSNRIHHFAVISFQVMEGEDVTVGIRDVNGRAIWTYSNDALPRGRALVVWDGRAADDVQAAAGLYQVIVRSGGRRLTKNIIIH